MSVFVDTGLFYAHQNDRSSRHETAVAALDAVVTGEYGRPYTSDYVHDEAVTLTLQRTGDHEQATEIGRRVRGVGDYPSAIELLHVAPPAFGDAVDCFERYADQELSFTDASTVALVEDEDVDHVLSFDDFDGLVDRLDPRTVAEHD